MHHTTRATLALALLTAPLASPSTPHAWAQPHAVGGLQRVPAYTPLVTVESIDATAKTVSIRESRVGPDGNITLSDPVKLPLSEGAKVIISESTLPASQLKVGDTVTLLGQRAPAGAVKLFTLDANGNPMPSPPRPGSGYIRSGHRAQEFEVIALTPNLTLRRGGIPADKSPNVGFLHLPFSNGNDGKPVGTLRMTEAENGTGTVTTLSLTDTKDLEFDRTTPTDLAALAGPLAAGQMSLHVDLSTAPDGARSVTRLSASPVKKENAQ
jgi:hypothetical protein